jgi:hypothetical protein
MKSLKLLLAVVILVSPSTAADRKAHQLSPEQRWNELEKALTAGTPIKVKDYIGKPVKLGGGPIESKRSSEMWLSTRVGDPKAITVRVRKTIPEVGRIERWQAFIKPTEIEGIIRDIDPQKREVLVNPTKAKMLMAM